MLHPESFKVHLTDEILCSHVPAIGGEMCPVQGFGVISFQTLAIPVTIRQLHLRSGVSPLRFNLQVFATNPSMPKGRICSPRREKSWQITRQRAFSNIVDIAKFNNMKGCKIGSQSNSADFLGN
jgi:hypothetical protein